MDWLDGIGSFLTNNSDWIKPAAAIGYGLYNSNQQEKDRNRIADIYRQKEESNYDQALANNAQYEKYLEAANAQANSNAAARSRAAGAYAAAARQTQANQQKALKKGMKRTNEGFEEAKGYLKPFYEAGVKVLPQATQAYSEGLNQLALLNAYLNNPQSMARREGSNPVWASNVPLTAAQLGVKG
jgi:DNA mismatch repair ATPase MutS